MEKTTEQIMDGINPYGYTLTDKDISDGLHRDAVGGMWDEIGQLQFDFLIDQGLKPHHKLLDLGCGCLRGGIHFVEYLDSGNYFGLDINQSLLDAGSIELDKAHLAHKNAHLLRDDYFRADIFEVKFDYAVSISLFTHLTLNHIIRALSEVKKVLREDSLYFTTFFEAPAPAHTHPITQEPGSFTTNYDSDPYHLSRDELAFAGRITGLSMEIIKKWVHPRNQKMARFTL